MVTQSTLERVPCMASSLANWCAQESQLDVDVDVDVVLVVSFGDGDVEDVGDDVHGADAVCMSSSPSNWSTAAQTRDLNDGG